MNTETQNTSTPATKKPRKPRIVAPKTPLELELEKGFERTKELTLATKQVARIVGKFTPEEQGQIIRQVWAFAQVAQPAPAPAQPEDGAVGGFASGN